MSQERQLETIINLSNDHIIDIPSEESPLVEKIDQRLITKKMSVVSCAAITIGSIVAGIVYLAFRNEKAANNYKIKYSFTAPHDNAGNIVIHNHNDYPIEVLDIKFTSNAVINTTSSSAIYGELAPLGEAKLEVLSAQNNAITYKLTESAAQKIIIEPNTSKNFTYLFDQVLGAVDVGVLPTNLDLTTPQGAQSLQISGQCEGVSCDDPFAGEVVGGYYTDWDMYGREYPAKNIPVKNLNTLYYAFIKYNSSGDVSLLDAYSDNIQLPALMELQHKFPYLKVLLSFGGYTLSSEFSALAQNPTARANFAKNVLAMLEQFKFSGIDIDWEYPSAAESNNFVSLLKTLRDQFDATGKKYLISIATSAGEDKISAIGANWKEVAKYVDYINLMAYDYNGPWSPLSDYQSPMCLPSDDPNGQALSIKATIGFYEKYGFPKEKISLGMPAYFRGVKVSSMQKNGIWQPVTGAPNGQWDNTGIYEYNCAVAKQCYQGSQMPADCVYLDEQQTLYGNYSRTPSIVCPKESAVFTGDSITSVKDKSCYALNNNMKGVFFWALSGDVRNDDKKSLLSAAADTFRSKTCPSTAEASMNHWAASLNIITDSQWQEFITKLQMSMALSYVGGIVLASLFKLVEKITNEILIKIFPQANSKKDQACMYFAVKTIIFLGALYYLGSPLLPAMVVNALVRGMISVGFSNITSLLSGTVASASITLGPNLIAATPQEIIIAVASLLSLYAGTHASSTYSMGKKLMISSFEQVSKMVDTIGHSGFFKRTMQSFVGETELRQSAPIFEV